VWAYSVLSFGTSKNNGSLLFVGVTRGCKRVNLFTDAKDMAQSRVPHDTLPSFNKITVGGSMWCTVYFTSFSSTSVFYPAPSFETRWYHIHVLPALQSVFLKVWTPFCGLLRTWNHILYHSHNACSWCSVFMTYELIYPPVPSLTGLVLRTSAAPSHSA
jgi:hypothetical protein